MSKKRKAKTWANNFDAVKASKQLNYYISKRKQLVRQQDNLWRVIKRGNNRKTEMAQITKSIGSYTYKIDNLLFKLIKSGRIKGHTYTISKEYLQEEIARNQRIANKWTRIIRDVDAGRYGLISSDGFEHRNTASSKVYLQKVKRKISKYQKLLNQLNSQGRR